MERIPRSGTGRDDPGGVQWSLWAEEAESLGRLKLPESTEKSTKEKGAAQSEEPGDQQSLLKPGSAHACKETME